MRLGDFSIIVGSMEMNGRNGVLPLEYGLYGLGISGVLGGSSFGGEREIGRRYSFSLVGTRSIVCETMILLKLS